LLEVILDIWRLTMIIPYGSVTLLPSIDQMVYVNLKFTFLLIDNATTTKPFVPSIWGRLHEPKENYAGSGTWINFLHSILSSNMPSLRPLASISCRITSIHVFFGLPCAFLTCLNLIRSTRRIGASVGLHRT